MRVGKQYRRPQTGNDKSMLFTAYYNPMTSEHMGTFNVTGLTGYHEVLSTVYADDLIEIVHIYVGF